MRKVQDIVRGGGKMLGLALEEPRMAVASARSFPLYNLYQFLIQVDMSLIAKFHDLTVTQRLT